MKENGKTVKLTAKAISGMQMEIPMRANGLQTKLTVKVYICMLTELDTSASGRTTYNMEKDRRLGLMVPVFKAIMWMEKSMARGFTNGRTVLASAEDGQKIRLMVLEFINGLTAVDLRVNGKIIICTDEAITLGLMVEATKGNILTIKSMDKASIIGQMAVNIMDSGRMVGNMDRGCIEMLMGLLRPEFGKKANE